MKKLFFTSLMLIAFNGISLANTIADKDITEELQLKEEAVACCTVGTETVCGFPFEDLCGAARALYCKKVKCTKAVVDSTGQ